MIAACKNVSACEHACLTSSPTFSGFLNCLRSSITLYDEIHPKSSTGVFYTDRQFHRNDPQGITPRENSRGRSNTRYHNNNRYPSKFKYPSRHRSPSSSKSCIVCNKEGCLSNKHSKAEREEAFQHLQNQKNKYNKRYTQFVADCGQSETAIPESIHLSQLISDLDLPDSEEFNEVYFTRLGPINGKKYLTELNKKASLYAFTSSTSNF
ncbi:BgTH12-04587 [Blumeria graminis f. sp. triticale]|uniref:Bgt-51276 n=2 Tax=Blumeria graminis TaxID=34373 RepID=A0A9X9PQK8_BLUGR|nr:BgTH12-04587 [Blumeria graminis f. sp. triticale]VCU39052.1 Bgt-51276 [Blumeria graminis f. sp. tritici]